MANGKQFDPVASATTAALDTTQRGIRNFQRQFGAPKLPAQSQSFSGLRSAVRSVADFAPANVMARGSLPGMGGEGTNGLPSPDQVIPGMGNGNGFDLPSLDSVFPSQNGNGSSNGSKNGNGSSNGSDRRNGSSNGNRR